MTGGHTTPTGSATGRARLSVANLLCLSQVEAESSPLTQYTRPERRPPFPESAPTICSIGIGRSEADTHLDPRPTSSPDIPYSPQIDYAEIRLRIQQEEQDIEKLVQEQQSSAATAAPRQPRLGTPPIETFGQAPAHWGKAEEARFYKLMAEFGSAWQAMWNENYLGWVRGIKADWIHPARDAKKYRYKARNLKVQILGYVTRLNPYIRSPPG